MEEEDRNPANEGGGVDCTNKSSKAPFGNQKPPPPLSEPNHRRAAEAAPEFAEEKEFHQQTALVLKEEVTWTWKRQQLQGCSGTINLYYRKTVLEDIRSVLTAVGGEKLLQQFSGGCFGHLMRFVGGLSCNKALHELISREISLACAREDELWFHISGTNIRFAPAEYALVTGLHFGSFSLGSQEMLPEGGVCERFCGAKSINIKKLWERFNSRGVSGSAEDYLKVAHVLVLYLMGLGYCRNRIIDEWVWVLVEDLDSWNRFPWGAYSYQALIRYVSLLPKTRTGSVMKYDFYGPVWALQIWAYEAIPHFGNTCALVIGQATIPRCLRWLFPLRKIDLAHFFEKELVCSVTLEPTDEEQLQAYWLSVQVPEPLGVQYNPPQRYGATASRARPLLSPDDTSSISEPSQQSRRPRASTRPSLSSGARKGCPQRLPKISDEACFVDRVSSRVVDRLTQVLIPKMKQWIVREVHDQLELMQGLLYAKSPGYNAESAKATEKKREEPSFDGGSSSMQVSRKTGNGLSVGKKKKKKPTPKDAFGDEEQFELLKSAPRSDTDVGSWEKQLVNRKHEPSTASGGAQIDFSEPSKRELKQKPVMSPPPREANITKKKKRTRRSLSWSEETSDDEGSKSSSVDERRKMKKRKHKKNKPKYSESSLSESSSGRDRHRSRRKRDKHRHSSSSDSDAGGSRRQRHQHHSVSLPD